MCGIAGFVDPAAPVDVRHDAVARMCAAMAHRGPDDAGIDSREPGTFGMRRLAIFDPANGHQPMATPDGRFHLIFNGALYNFRELRAELSCGGYGFRTLCDTEVLLAAYARWGQSCLDRLRGMFAFAVWDAADKTLFLARDPFGIKPLYYRHAGNQLLFASELNALLASGVFDAEIDPAGVADYLAWFAVPAPRTIYRGLQSLRPGESAVFRDGQLEIQTSWQFRSLSAPPNVCRSQAEFEHELRARLDDSIRAHALADVPVGAFLSGGLDSAAVVGLMARASRSQLKTFSIGFAETEHDESTYAAATARHFGTEHQTRILTGAEVARDLPALLAALDQPTGDGVNTYYVSQTARAGGVTVALSGLGGDELLGGYPSFHDLPRLARLLPAWRRLPAPLRRAIVARIRRRGTRLEKLADFLEHARNRHELCSLQRRVFAEPQRRALLSLDLRTAVAAQPPHHPELAHLVRDLAGTDLFATISAWELRTYMADVLLRDSDIMSMRHSLELRVPFVDRPLIEWLWRQPSRLKDDRRQPKAALARALADLLPPDLAQRRKRGFILPFAAWMRTDLRPFLEETFSTASVTRSGWFDASEVQHFWRDYLRGDDARQWSRVWSLAVLINFINRPRPHPPLRPRPWPVLPSPSEAPAAPTVAVRSPRTRSPARRRTLLLAPEIFASEGGIARILQTYLKALCELAAPAGAVRLVALNDAMMDSRDLRRCATDRLTDWEVCAGRKARFVRAALAQSRGCDHLLCGHVGQLPVALAARLRHPRLHYSLIAHGIEVWRPFSLAERLALRGAERILCVSDFTRREFLRFCPAVADRCVVLPNALDPAFPIAPGLPRNPDAPVILTVSRLSRADRYKGIDHLIQALPAIRARLPHATLRVVGRGDDLPHLQQLRQQLGLTGAVDFLGFVDDRALAAELRACSLFALPSQREGFGLVFLEAMAHGRPCLGARAGGIPEVLTPDTGVLTEFGDVPALADACVAALQRDWDEAAILARARAFSYSPFKDKLASLLAL